MGTVSVSVTRRDVSAGSVAVGTGTGTVTFQCVGNFFTDFSFSPTRRDVHHRGRQGLRVVVRHAEPDDAAGPRRLQLRDHHRGPEGDAK